MVTTAAFIGIAIVLIGLGLSAYAIYSAHGRGESQFRCL
jgi:hypothetical protein